MNGINNSKFIQKKTITAHKFKKLFLSLFIVSPIPTISRCLNMKTEKMVICTLHAIKEDHPGESSKAQVMVTQA